MTGRITHLIHDQQFGTIVGEDGIDYHFDSRSLFGVTFGQLTVGAPVSFVRKPETNRATIVRAGLPRP